MNAQDGSMGHHAEQALVSGTGGRDDHLALALAQAAFLLEHQRIVVGKKARHSAGRRAKARNTLGMKPVFPALRQCAV